MSDDDRLLMAYRSLAVMVSAAMDVLADDSVADEQKELARNATKHAAEAARAIADTLAAGDAE